jgi:predicted RNase H-like nuclease|tara:strand:+ start:690 stop:896 length:207 start_codon:yes stop_codon:yes gene_type:complete
MKVSKQVEDSVKEAIESLRNALAFAARTEEPYIAKHIADKIMELDGLIKVNQLLDDLEEIRENHTKDN